MLLYPYGMLDRRLRKRNRISAPPAALRGEFPLAQLPSLKGDNSGIWLGDGGIRLTSSGVLARVRASLRHPTRSLSRT